MKLRAFALILLPLALGLLAAPLPAEAQEAGKVYRVGYLGPRGAAPHLRAAFVQRLHDLGWIEGQNLIIEWRFAEGRMERLPDLAAELVRLKVDVIVAPGGQASQAAVDATRMIPIVFTLVGDPVGRGFVASLARPGGNATGLSNLAVELSAKRLELLRETIPKVSRVAVLWITSNPDHPLMLGQLGVAARALGVQLQILGVRGPDEFDSAFEAMTREYADALIVMPDALTWFHRIRLADLAAKNRLPAMYGLAPNVEAGGLMAYAANFTDFFRHAATYVDKILRGTKPADLPVEQPTKFELVINMKTAKALGLTIPDSLLFQADRVIK